MSLKLTRLGEFLMIIGGSFLILASPLRAQNCIPTNINGTTINLACNQTCTSLNFSIPHLKSSSDYTLVTVPYNPYPYNTVTGIEYNPLYADDQYSNLISLPFPFCFYDSVFNSCVVGSNGLLTFDPGNASCSNAWPITTPIPFAGGSICNSGVTYYPKSAIMVAYSDLDPRIAGTSPIPSPGDRKIQWEVIGTAPCRKFVVSYYHIGVFGTACGQSTPNTFQMVIHESTGIIEIFCQQKACFSTTNSGRAIMGIQNWNRDKALAAPGKNFALWSETNTGYRFVPSAGASRYVVSQLYTLGGSLVATADTATTAQGTLDLSFPNICAPSGNNTYVVRTTFSSCSDPLTQLISFDTVYINRTNGLNATSSTTPTACGPPSGSITVNIGAGLGSSPFTYTLDGGAPQTTPAITYTFNNVAQGPHTVIIVDASGGCTSTLSINVSLTSVLNATTSNTTTSCPGVSNGSITVNMVNGTGPYSYSLDGGLQQLGPLPFTFNSVPAGNHNVVVRDLSNGCISNSIPVTVAAGPALATSVNKTDVLCNAGATGSITVTPPSTGTPPYQYSLDGITWQPSNVFNGLAAGTYPVYYKESSGCQGNQLVTITEPAALAPTASTTPAICNGQNNGVITVSPAGGVGPYQYSINGGATWQSGITFNVGAGNYTITIKDNNNCSTTRNVSITQPNTISGSSVNSNASCDGGADGTITVTANGGNGGFQYSIDGINFQASNLFNVLQGNYTVTIKDNMGCSSSFNTTVGQTSNLVITPQVDQTICEGSSTPLNLVSNATQYSWSPATGLSAAAISNPVASPTTTTQYIVTATLGNCSNYDTVIINVNAAPIPDAGTNGAICYGQSYQLQASGGTQFSWKPTTYLNSNSIANPVTTPDRTITYTLSVVDANNCPSLVTDSVLVDVTQPIRVITLPYDTIGYPGDQFQLNAISGGNIYSWSPSTGLSNAGIPDPVVTIGGIGADIIYRVTASTAAGCKGEGYVRVRVYTGPEIYVPTGFTPNNDGKNDEFIPFPVGIKQLNYLRVYNRWGQLMYSTSTLNVGWDGKYAGKEQPSGVYVWMIQAVTKDDKLITKKGTVALIR